MKFSTIVLNFAILMETSVLMIWIGIVSYPDCYGFNLNSSLWSDGAFGDRTAAQEFHNFLKAPWQRPHRPSRGACYRCPTLEKTLRTRTNYSRPWRSDWRENIGFWRDFGNWQISGKMAKLNSIVLKLNLYLHVVIEGKSACTSCCLAIRN